jgi:predicted DsbA family dithiol-disulfide isomerase
MAALGFAHALFVLALTTIPLACGASGGAGAPAAPGSPGDVTLPGVDTSMLTPREKHEWSHYVTDFLAPCPDVPVSIAQCVSEKRACARCAPAAKFLAKGVRDGMASEQIEHSYRDRFSADHVHDVPVDGSPSKGSETAAVTLIEFADFECPHCGLMAPRLDALAQAHPSDVRMVYKFMPLVGHPHADPAARAAIAAGDQGKFWEMHKLLFENQTHLEEEDLEGYAKQLKLDLGRFRADMQSPATTDRIARDRKLADALAVKGTPTIYVNGREYDIAQDLNDWVDLELANASASHGASVAK